MVLDCKASINWQWSHWSIFIDRIAGEILLVASMCVRPFVCGRSPMRVDLDLG